MKAKDKLRAYWSQKDRDLMLDFPLGTGTSSDGHYLSHVFNKEFTDELESRGYDVSTMKFEVCPKVGNGLKFASQRNGKPRSDFE